MKPETTSDNYAREGAAATWGSRPHPPQQSRLKSGGLKRHELRERFRSFPNRAADSPGSLQIFQRLGVASLSRFVQSVTSKDVVQPQLAVDVGNRGIDRPAEVHFPAGRFVAENLRTHGSQSGFMCGKILADFGRWGIELQSWSLKLRSNEPVELRVHLAQLGLLRLGRLGPIGGIQGPDLDSQLGSQVLEDLRRLIHGRRVVRLGERAPTTGNLSPSPGDGRLPPTGCEIADNNPQDYECHKAQTDPKKTLRGNHVA